MGAGEENNPAAAPAVSVGEGNNTGGFAKRPIDNQRDNLSLSSYENKTENERSNKRRRCGSGTATVEPPKSREEMSDEELKATLKRQVEYYLSDGNLATDGFFHEKIQEAEKQGKGVALDISFVLSSPRIRALNASKQEILDALAGSTEITVKNEDGGNTYLVRSGPLPVLKKKERKEVKRREDTVGRDPHAVGCMVKLSNLPAEAPKWQSIKDALREKLPEKVQIRYVSRVDNKQQCTVWLGSFKGDREFFKEPVNIQVEGSEASLTLMTPGDVRACCSSDLPPRVRVSREKELQQFRRQLAALPLCLSGTPFNSVDHLHKCMNDLLEKTEAGKQLKPESVAEKAVLALLEYHPNAFFKKGGSDKVPFGVKVDFHEKTNKSGDKSKCFFVMRKHKETQEEDAEDFSLSKCISELSLNPPLDPEAFKAFMEKRYEAAAAAFEAAQQQLQKRKAAAAEAAAATGTLEKQKQTKNEKQEKEGAAVAPQAASESTAGQSDS